MKSKLSILIISVVLVIAAVITAVIFVNKEKAEKVQLDESDITLSDFIVDGQKMKVTIKSANSLGLKISDNSYTYKDGVLKFKIFGSKDLEIGSPLDTNEIKTLKITAPGDIKEIYFVTVGSDGKEKETKKSFTRGAF